MFDKSKIYSIDEAIKIVKDEAKEKFDASLEVHLRLGIDAKKGEQQVRGSAPLPHGSGKTVKVAVFAEGDEAKAAKEAGADLVGGDDLIKEIKASEKASFDVAVAHPGMMSKLAQVAKILGPKGLMPSPKQETVTPNVARAVKELKAGKISFKNDDTGIVHSVIGKLSFDSSRLAENYKVFITAVRKLKPTTSKGDYFRSVYICSSMGPSVKVVVS